MPPQPATAPSGPAKPGAGKRLPLWVWLAAGAVGLLVGLLLLRRAPANGEGEPEEESEQYPADEGKGGGGGAGLPPDLLQAFGMTPSYQMPSFSEGFFEAYSDGGGGEQSAAQETFFAEAVPGANQPRSKAFVPAPTPRTTSSAAPAAGQSTAQFLSSLRPPTPAPAPPPTPGGGGVTYKTM